MKLFFIIFVIIIYEIIICIIRKLKRKIYYKKAVKRAKETNKKLLVIGDPYNGIASIVTGLDYKCGDVCIDLTGCPKCENAIKGKLEDILPTLNLNEYVIYISCVLEYVDDLNGIMTHLNKLNKDDLFIVNVEWYSLMAYFYPYYLTNEQPPKYIKSVFGYIKNPTR